MDNEPYRDIGHHEAADIIASIIGERNAKTWREYRLPSGVIADVFVVLEDGTTEIYEVKSTFKASLLDAARGKYAHWANRLWYAVPNLTCMAIEDERPSIVWRQGRDQLGLVGVYRNALAIYRQPVHTDMLASLRAASLADAPKPWSVGETGGHGPLVSPKA
jgi:hypothetical protein